MSTHLSPIIRELIESLRCLPGVGPKSAQRMAFHILERDKDNGLQLSKALEKAITKVQRCTKCRTLSEEPLCRVCAQKSRDNSTLCVVESPMDTLAIEQTGHFRGFYFVLMGRLSPLDGIGPEQIGVALLKERLKQGEIKEVILATNSTVEGEATAQYLTDVIRPFNIKTSRIAHGVPLGGELEYVDGGTLSHALSGRKTV